MMAVEGITAAASAVQTNSSSGTTQDMVSELAKLKQDVQKLKSHYEDKANKKGMSQIQINAKIRKYEKLITKIEEEIRQIKKNRASKPVGLNKNQKTKNNDSDKKNDSSALSVAALKTSYRMLFSASLLVDDLSQSDKSDLESSLGTNLDQLI